MNTQAASHRISAGMFGKEPFRIFFPAGTLAGILGAALWPLYFWGFTKFYPGLGHARIMTLGLFGGFILGFLGTAMPRMLTAKPLRLWEVVPLVLLHGGMVISFAAGRIEWGDTLFLGMLVLFTVSMAPRVKYRQDLPPPGFMLVGLAFLSVLSGAVLAMIEHRSELDPWWISVQRLLLYQGFVLLPILGIGPFILPRFFGMKSAHDFPESMLPTRPWLNKALLALGAGVLVIATFFIEASGWYRTAYGLRFGVTLAYLVLEMPFRKGPEAMSALGAAIRIAFVGILAGFLTNAFFPAYRVSLLHLTLVGGFAVITFVVATRVVYGHSGNLAKLRGRNRWLIVAVGLMLFGMATRMSGDFWPAIMASHYIYGAISWIVGVLIWAVWVLPKVLTAEPED